VQHGPTQGTGEAAKDAVSHADDCAVSNAASECAEDKHQQDKLRKELKAVLARMERLQEENERLMELGAELRAERELLVAHLAPAFVEAVWSGTAPPVITTGSCIYRSSIEASAVGRGPSMQCMPHSCWTADATDNSNSGASGGYVHHTGQNLNLNASALNHQAQFPAVLHDAAADQWISPPVQDGSAFVCQNADPNTCAVSDSLWVRESQVLRERDLMKATSELPDDALQPHLIPALHNTLNQNVLAYDNDDGAAIDPLQRHQKCVDTSDLDRERNEVHVVSVGSELNEGVSCHTDSKGNQTGSRGAAQRWPVQNSARGTTSQRVRLHALSKRRDGVARAEKAKFEPSIKARNWNLVNDDT
jgi:hypothetical protein